MKWHWENMAKNRGKNNNDSKVGEKKAVISVSGGGGCCCALENRNLPIISVYKRIIKAVGFENSYFSN